MYEIGEPEIQALARTIRRTMNGGSLFRYGGVESERFEEAWSRKIGVEHTIGVNSGTSSLICALVGLGVGPGDEVIVPAYTFMASPLAVLATGAIPVIAEIDSTLTIDPKDVERKITRRTKAVMPVHMCGLPSNMTALMRIARRCKLRVAEDCCQADGGSYKGKRLGSIGHAGGFSFNYFKIVSCGDGGAMVTSDRVCYERALIHHDGGCIFRPHARELGVHPFAGQNYRMLEIQAAVMNEQLKRLDRMLGRMRRVKKKIYANLEGHPKLRLMKSNDMDGDCGATVGFNFESEKQRKRFCEALAKSGVIAAGSPIDSGRHVYCNWEPIMEERGAHHPAMDPYRMPANRTRTRKRRYSKGMCRASLDVLARNAMFGTSPAWDAKRIDAVVRACETAAEGI
ncbi:MAG TPA: DegT/DnrJ/EryC1/StrS family aminotransferase [Sumerlaeia bacterium]|nr:DegT/DnrJ/EryC1/StrS family aminotransferase [Sumerlaeia bacterium]